MEMVEFCIKNFQDITSRNGIGRQYIVFYVVKTRISTKQYQLILRVPENFLIRWRAEYTQMYDTEYLAQIIFNYCKDEIINMIVKNKFIKEIHINEKDDYEYCRHCDNPEPIILNQWISVNLDPVDRL